MISFQNKPIIFETKEFPLFIDHKYSAVIILTDQNVEKHCLEEFKRLSGLRNHILISIAPGEGSKTLETVGLILDKLIEYKVDRKALLINFGGGMISDLGGFCASIYKRGIKYINVPTSLLGMTDAAIGGKTGVDHLSIKNVAGTFYLPEAVLIHTGFLKTLPHKEYINGMAEIIKHAIIDDADLWGGIIAHNEIGNELPEEFLRKSIQVKTSIVDADYLETGERKKLNFGHTIGHALEGFYIHNNKELPHGLAVAAGMRIESWLNKSYGNLSDEDFEEITDIIEKLFYKIPFEERDIEDIIAYMKNDKKTEKEQIQITQIQSIGFSLPSLKITPENIKSALSAYIKNLNHSKTF